MATSPVLAIMPPDIPAQPRAPSLFALETDLQAMLDSAELVEPDQQAEFAADLEAALATTISKRDRTQGFLVHCESLVARAAEEIKRLQIRKAFFEAVVERVEFSVVRTIKNLGVDAKGKYRTLQGETVAFSVRRCPVSVAITDEAKVPASFKTVTITLPALSWEALLDSLEMEARAKLLGEIKRPDSAVNKPAVKEAIEAAAPAGWKDALKEEGALPVRVDAVPGAAILPGDLNLVRR
jgi:Siphovirus Gp157